MTDVEFEQIERLADAVERQAEATERLVEELEYQNAALTEVARAVHVVADAHKDYREEYDSVPSLRSLEGHIEDHRLTREEDGGRYS